MKEVENVTNMLREAHKGQYAVGSFSPRYTLLVRPVLEAAIAMHSPVIIQLSEKEVIRHEVSVKAFAHP